MSDLAKLPFIAEGTLAANEEVTLYVKDDPIQGLKEPGGTGYIINDGPGSITVQCSDDKDGLSDLSTINIFEHLVFEKDDDVEVKVIHIIADALGAAYRARFARIR
jgi:hypothetical protein